MHGCEGCYLCLTVSSHTNCLRCGPTLPVIYIDDNSSQGTPAIGNCKGNWTKYKCNWKGLSKYVVPGKAVPIIKVTGKGRVAYENTFGLHSLFSPG